MTARIGTMSVDGTPISQADMARIEAEEALHSEQRRSAVKVVAGASLDADDCRTLLAMLGMDETTVRAARADLAPAAAAPKRARKSRAA